MHTGLKDNEGVVQLARNPVTNYNSKHVHVRHHFLRELVGREEISVIHVSSAFQHADFVAKAIAQDSFQFLSDFAMNL